MFLYTPLSDEDIYPREENQSERKIISYQGKSVHVEKTTDGTYQVLQLLSTDPQDFLNDAFNPGNIITNS